MNSVKTLEMAFWLVCAVVYVISAVIKANKAREQAEAEAKAEAAAPPAPSTAPRGRPAEPRGTSDALRLMVTTQLTTLIERSRSLDEEAQRESRNRRFAEVLGRWIPVKAEQTLAWASARTDTATWLKARVAAEGLEAVFGEVKLLIRQRRDPTLRDQVGQADALADACYAPIIAFAQAHDLPLTSAWPATQLADFDLALWSGFSPTSIAPIFLPPEFFSRAAWWPALAHEIGHDFLISLPALDLRLRAQLGVPTAREGAEPVQVVQGMYHPSEPQRLYGVWFEETFCDVFGTLMCGPGFVASMIELFAPTGDKRSVRVVERDPENPGTYDVHPPRHLRVLCCLAVLETLELHDEARRLGRRWKSLSEETEAPEVLYVPVWGGVAELPVEPFMARAREIVRALCTGQLEPLGGFSLTDIPGLDYGPHEHAAALRARDALLGGAALTSHDPRAIISGAVLAAIQSPSQEAAILAAARAMIPSLGAIQRQRDLYSGAPRTEPDVAQPVSLGDELVEALIAREIFGPPRSRRRLQGGRTATSRE